MEKSTSEIAKLLGRNGGLRNIEENGIGRMKKIARKGAAALKKSLGKDMSEHYRKMAIKSAAARKKNRAAKEALEKGLKKD